jgi:toxin ParE1/3/4
MAEYIVNEKAIENLNSIWIFTAEIWSVDKLQNLLNF